MKKILIPLILVTFLTSCAQLRDISGDPGYGSENERERVLSSKVEDRDINLPDGSTILDEDSGFSFSDLIGNDSSNFELGIDSITFRVALDKISFMPLASVDSISGIIVTDWYSLNDGNSRIKINIRIVDQEMTENSVTVSLFSQTLSNDRWVDEGINKEQSLKIKESILSSARALKIASEL